MKNGKSTEIEKNIKKTEIKKKQKHFWLCVGLILLFFSLGGPYKRLGWGKRGLPGVNSVPKV